MIPHRPSSDGPPNSGALLAVIIVRIIALAFLLVFVGGTLYRFGTLITAPQVLRSVHPRR